MKVSIFVPSPEGTYHKELRIRANLTHRRLGELTGHHRATSGLVETGQWRPSLGYLRRFAASLGLTLAEEQKLLALRNEPHQHAYTPEAVGTEEPVPLPVSHRRYREKIQFTEPA